MSGNEIVVRSEVTERDLWEVVTVKGKEEPTQHLIMAKDQQEAVLLAAAKTGMTEEEIKEGGVRVFSRPFRSERY